MHKHAVVAFAATFLICAFVGFIAVQNRMAAEREHIERIIMEHAYKMNQVVSNQLYRTQALAALVINGDGTVDNFQWIASVLARDVPALAAFLLAPDGIVVDAFPLEDNLNVLGLNFFDEDDHAGNREAIQARDTGNLVMGGPFVLRSGIMGLTGRYPVYINTEGNGREFWGLVAVSLKFPQALEDAGLSMLTYQGVYYELWRIDPDTSQRQIIATNATTPSRGAYIERTVDIHNAAWYFRIFPLRPWYMYMETWLMFFGTLTISLFVAVVIQTRNTALARGKVSIMLSQIQPHFLYNALSAVAQLCDENPVKAKKATIDFSTYLRGNMESLSEKKLIAIEKELEHVRGYLDLEKAIYGSALHVVYRINATGFMLPPLTVQPLAENAVKHGIGQKEGGGTVALTVDENENAYIITVEDDGVGYNASATQRRERKPIGIINVRQRLKEQCGGTLEITGNPGQGTRVVVRIPK
jgi:sensor domain CHASE-containing protein